MPLLFWDVESRSAVDLEVVGAWRYAADPTTEVLCIGFAVDDGPPEIWIPGQAVPAPFHEAASDTAWEVIAHNYGFERAITTCILEPRFGWPQIPLPQQRCTMSMALASAMPGALEAAAAALGLPFQKDREGYRLMRQMARPRRPLKGEDRDRLYWVDGPEQRGRLHQYCLRDVEAERALFRQLPPLVPSEQAVWELDARINQRGFHVDVALAHAARKIARVEQAAIDAEVARLTNGEITSVHQRDRILAFVRRHGHVLETLTKRSVADVLAHEPADAVRHLLELRQQGARASVRKLDRLLQSVEADRRMRGSLRFHGSSTGRWSGRGYQPQNLKKPETKDLGTAVEAILAGDMERILVLGAPLTVAGDVSRAMITAAPGNVLIGGDFSAIESRVLAWLANEGWKLETYRKYDRTGDPLAEPYCATATRILKRQVTPDQEGDRTIGKICDLGFGFGGGLGAWRRFEPTDTYTDTQVEGFKTEWRRTHQATQRFWRDIKRAALQAVITRQPIDLGNGLSFSMQGTSLLMTLPSGRSQSYPEARLGPGKFEGQREVHFKDNARGGWSDCRSWYGTLTENAVQAVARDLLAAAMQRLERAGYAIVLHVHDEIVCEVPEGFGSTEEFHRLLTELPDWVEGLPIAAKVWSAARYAKTNTPPAETATGPATAIAVPLIPETCEALDTEEATAVPLAQLIGEELVDGKTCCPYHDDRTPSLHIYHDHFHCFVCGAHGSRLDWLRDVEGLSREEALELLSNWQGPLIESVNEDATRSLGFALRLWDEARPITDTVAVRYLQEVRKIDVDALPPQLDQVLRFHVNCPFGSGPRLPCLLALYRDVVTDAPAGIHRIALTAEVLRGGSKVERRALGRWPTPRAIKLWPAGTRLFLGEGIETVLAAATRRLYRGELMQPAWAAGTAGALAKFPVLPNVERLLILVDHDPAGQRDARAAAERWRRAGRTAVLLTPKRPGADFNDLVLGEHHERG